jgi:hypothetical protein
MIASETRREEYGRDGAVLLEQAFVVWVGPPNDAIKSVLSAWRRRERLEPLGSTYGIPLDVAENFWGGAMARRAVSDHLAAAELGPDAALGDEVNAAEGDCRAVSWSIDNPDGVKSRARASC